MPAVSFSMNFIFGHFRAIGSVSQNAIPPCTYFIEWRCIFRFSQTGLLLSAAHQEERSRRSLASLLPLFRSVTTRRWHRHGELYLIKRQLILFLMMMAPTFFLKPISDMRYSVIVGFYFSRFGISFPSASLFRFRESAWWYGYLSVAASKARAALAFHTGLAYCHTSLVKTSSRGNKL